MLARTTGGTARWEEDFWGSQTLMKRSNINRDTYLNCWCPTCGKGLNEDRKAVFRIIKQKGVEELQHAQPYLNVLEQVCKLQLDDEELVGVSCPHCNTPFIEEEQTCESNHCKVAKIHVSVQDSIRLSLNFCVGHSCRSYSMTDEDNERLILRESHEW